MQGKDVEIGAKVDSLDFARSLRRQGRSALARQVLETAAQGLETTVHWPPTKAKQPNPGGSVQQRQLGWILLELADLQADATQWSESANAALGAWTAFDRAEDGVGVAASCLCLGDLAWRTGDGRTAANWWARARSAADASGATLLAARSLLALGIREWLGGDPAVGSAQLDAAADRVAALEKAADGDDPQLAATQAEALRAGVSLVRARQAMERHAWEDARLLLSTVAEVGKTIEEPLLYIDALRLDAALSRRLGQPQNAAEALGLAIAVAQGQRLEQLLAFLYAEQTLALSQAGDLAQAAAAHHQGLAQAVDATPFLHALRLEGFAGLARLGQEPQAALDALAQALELRIDHGDSFGALRVRLNCADLHLRQGDVAAAVALAEQAQGIAQTLERWDWQLEASQLLVHAGLLQGMNVCAGVDRVVAQLAQAESPLVRLHWLDLQAAARLATGQTAAAATAAAQALQIAELLQLPGALAQAQTRQAEVHLARFESQAALQLASQSCVTAQAQMIAPEIRARALLVAGMSLLAVGRWDEAIASLEQSQDQAQLAGRTDLFASAGFELGRALQVSQQPAAAAKHWLLALNAAAKLSMNALQIKILRGIARVTPPEDGRATGHPALDQARALAVTADLADAYATVVMDLAQRHVTQRDLGGAEQLVASLDLQNRPQLPPVIRGEGWTIAAQIRAMLHDFSSASELIGKALPLLREAGEPQPLGAALLLAGQLEGALGHGAACGALLSEALVCTAKHGLPEQAVIRRVIDRLERQARDQ